MTVVAGTRAQVCSLLQPLGEHNKPIEEAAILRKGATKMRAGGTKQRAFLGMYVVAVVGLLVLTFAPSPAGATTLTFNLNTVFSGNTPAGPTPWLIAQFRDGANCAPACAAGTVQLVLTSNLTSGQFTTEWDFNSSNLSVVVTYDGANALNAGSYAAPTIQKTSLDAYKADGDGFYDIEIDFASKAGSGTPDSNRFDGSDVAVFTLTGSGITVATFNQLSVGGALGAFHTAAHIQGIPGGCSGWVGDGEAGVKAGGDGPCTGTVPEPSTLLLLGSGLAGVGFWGRKIFLSRRAA